MIYEADIKVFLVDYSFQLVLESIADCSLISNCESSSTGDVVIWLPVSRVFLSQHAQQLLTVSSVTPKQSAGCLLPAAICALA